MMNTFPVCAVAGQTESATTQVMNDLMCRFILQRVPLDDLWAVRATCSAWRDIVDAPKGPSPTSTTSPLPRLEDDGTVTRDHTELPASRSFTSAFLEAREVDGHTQPFVVGVRYLEQDPEPTEQPITAMVPPPPLATPAQATPHHSPRPSPRTSPRVGPYRSPRLNALSSSGLLPLDSSPRALPANLAAEEDELLPVMPELVLPPIGEAAAVQDNLSAELDSDDEDSEDEEDSDDEEEEDVPVFSQVYIFDPASKKSYDLPPLPVDRLDCNVFVLDDHVYVCGGMLELCQAQASLYRYSLAGFRAHFARSRRNCRESGRWEVCASMRQGRAGASVCVTDNGQVMVCGGWSLEHGLLSSVELYNPASNTWTQGPALPSPRAWAASARLGKHFVVSRTEEGSTALDGFDAAKGRWVKLAAAPHSLQRSDFIVQGDSLRCIHAADEGSAHRRTSLFDGKAWHESEAVPTFKGTVLPLRRSPARLLVLSENDSGEDDEDGRQTVHRVCLRDGSVKTVGTAHPVKTLPNPVRTRLPATVFYF